MVNVVSMNGFSKKFTGGIFRPIRKYLEMKKLLRQILGERNTLMGNAQGCAKIIKQSLCQKKVDFTQGCAKKLIYKIKNGYG